MQFLCDAIVLVFGFFFGVPTCTTHCDAVTRDLIFLIDPSVLICCIFFENI